jgi:hypothetical protein
MLILPPGHAQTIRQRRAFRPREKGMIAGVVGVLALMVVVLVIAVASTGKKPGHGCVSVALAYSTGGEQIDRCGAAARALCGGVGRVGGVTGAAAETLSTACRKAGIRAG